MKHKVTHTKKTERQVEVEVSKETVAAEIEKVCREVACRAKIPGYRPGKAPLNIVQKHYEADIMDEAMRGLLTTSLSRAIEESKIPVVGEPSISDISFDEHNGMSYKATVSIIPEIEIRRYRGLKLKKNRRAVTDKEIDAALKYFQESHASYMTRDGAARSGDYLICDVECRVGETSADKRENLWLSIDDEAFIPTASLLGAKAGDVRRANKVLPAEYPKKEFAGKEAGFLINIKEVKEKVAPELNDELAKSAAGVKGLDELKKIVRENLESTAEREMRSDLENQALDILVKDNQFDVPESMIERQLDRLIKDTKARLKAQGVPQEQSDKRESDLREKFRQDAKKQVRVYLLLDKIADSEKIKIGDAELDKVFEEMAASYKQDKEAIKRYYEDHQLTEGLRDKVRIDKTIGIIISNAVVT